MQKRPLLITGGIALLALILIISLWLGVELTQRNVSDSSTAPSFGMGVASSEPQIAFGEMAEEGKIAADRDAMFYPGGDTAGLTAADVDQKIIKTGTLRIVVDHVSESTTAISTLASTEGGFVQQSSLYERGDGTHEGSITIRVPADRFEAVVQSVKQLANVVETETVSGQDVTEQFTDMQAQLRNARAQEETFLAVLDQAETVEDILNVQRELGYIRAQIESLEGRIQYLENATSYSTISIFLSEEPRLSIPTKEFRPLASIREAAQALIAIGQQMVVGLIWLLIVGGGILVPLGLLGWAIIWAVIKLIKRTPGVRR